MRVIDTTNGTIHTITITNNNGIEFSQDFFDAGTLDYNDELDAYYGDVDYMIQQIKDYINHEGDFADFEDDTTGTTLFY